MLNNLLNVFSNQGQIYGGLSFEWPWLWLLFPFPLLFIWLPATYGWHTALQVPFYERLAQAGITLDFNPQRLSRYLFLWLLWFMLILSASKPVWIGDPIQLSTRGRDFMLAVDISGSMETRDMRSGTRLVRRIDAVKSVLGDFINRRVGDRIGLILFGSLPYLQAPLSFDLKAIHTLLLESELGFAGQKTAVGDAIGLAVKRLHERPGKQRILILLTDGSNNAGHINPIRAAQLAREENIRIYTIGIGADSVSGGFFGRSRVNQSLDEYSLQQIAKTTGGLYYRARDPTSLNKISSALDKLEPLQQAEELFRPRTDLYYIPLAIAMLCSMLFTMLLMIKQYFMRSAL